MSVSSLIIYYIFLIKDILRFSWILIVFYVTSAIKLIFIQSAPKNVKGHVVMITGGTTELGKNLAMKFAEMSCKVAIVDIDREAGERTALEIKRKNNNVMVNFYQADVSDNKTIHQLQKDVFKDFGHVDILINNTELIDSGSLERNSSENFANLVNGNFLSHILLIKAFFGGMMEEERGHIVSIISSSSILPSSKNMVSSSAKNGVLGFTLGLNEYFRSKKWDFIKVTCVVCPRSRKSSTETADSIIAGILEEKVLFSIPTHLIYAIRIFTVLPVKLQEAYRDVVIKNLNWKKY